jgi:probable phosphoglycerate mutase
MRLFLARHGETIENTKRIVTGRNHGTLSVAGIKQALRLADSLKNHKFKEIYSSTLYRSVVTTQVIAAYQQNTEVKYLDLLQEMDFGEYTGKITDEIDWNIQTLSGETPIDVIGRVESFLKNYIFGNYKKNDKVLVVCHHLVINAFIVYLMNLNPNEIRTLNHQKSNALNIFELSKSKKNVRTIVLNSIDHYA